MEQHSDVAAELDKGATDPGYQQTIKKLGKRYGRAKMSFLQAYKQYVTPALLITWICNLASGAGIFYLVKMIFQDLPGSYTSTAIGLVALFGFEWCKRKASDNFWDDFWMNAKTINWGKGSLNWGLFGLSLAATIYGVFYLVNDTTPGAEQMDYSDKPEAAALVESIREKEERVLSLQAENTTLRADKANYNSKGEFYHVHARTERANIDRMANLETEISGMQGTLREQFGVVDIKNQEIIAAWEDRRNVRVGAALLACFLLEIIFEACMAFLSLYDWKKYQFFLALHNRRLLVPTTP